MNDFLRLENRHTGEVLRLRRVHDASGEIVLALEGALPPGSSGPPPHIHFHQREEGSVIAGTLGAQVRKEKLVVPTGGKAAFGAGIVHCWWNAGEDLLEFSGRAVPAADLDRFLQGIFGVINAGAKNRPSIFYLAHVLWRHRRTQAVTMPPPAIQKVLFPVVLMIGRILGKYRGQDWPGSPESCSGAPMVERAIAGTTA